MNKSFRNALLFGGGLYALAVIGGSVLRILGLQQNPVANLIPLVVVLPLVIAVLFRLARYAPPKWSVLAGLLRLLALSMSIALPVIIGIFIYKAAAGNNG